MSDTWGAAFGGATVDAMQVYEDVLVPRLFTPWAALLLDELDLKRGEAVLDVACGPGSVARLAAERVGREGRVTACDLSPAMLAIAKAKPQVDGAPIEYIEAPADDLPVEDEAYDVATCQQGLQFFPDTIGALRELRRALKPGGRAGVAVWAELEANEMHASLGAAIQEVAGDELAARFRNGPWGKPSADWLREQLAAAEFEDVRVEQRELTIRFEGGTAQVLPTLAATGIAEDIDAFPPGEKQRLVEAYERHAANLIRDGALVAKTASNVAIARR